MRDIQTSKAEERARMTRVFFGVFTNDSNAKSVDLNKFMKTIERGATVNYKRLAQMSIDADSQTLHS